MANILAVDDDELYRDIYQSILSDAGHDVVFSAGAQLGIDAALASPPDLIIMDLNMPEMSGIEAIRRIRSEATLKETPILAVTMMEDTQSYDEIYEAGGDGYVSKPIDATHLIARIKTMLSK